MARSFFSVILGGFGADNISTDDKNKKDQKACNNVAKVYSECSVIPDRNNYINKIIHNFRIAYLKYIL